LRVIARETAYIVRVDQRADEKPRARMVVGVAKPADCLRCVKGVLERTVVRGTAEESVGRFETGKSIVEKRVETVAVFSVGKMPLAPVRRAVAGGGENVADRRYGRIEAGLRVAVGEIAIKVHFVLCGIGSRKQAGSRGRAGTRADEVVVERNTLAGDTVYVGCFEKRRPARRSHLIDQDEKNVRSIRRGERSTGSESHAGRGK